MTSELAPVLPSGEAAPSWSWERLRGAVLACVSSRHSKRVYGKALDDFREWCQAASALGFTRETVLRYRADLEDRGLAPASVSLRMTVVRRLAREAAAHGLLSYEEAGAAASVKGSRPRGARIGTWLTLEQAQALLRAPAGDGVRALRDRALLAVMIGCGLRRGEVAGLCAGQIQQREGRPVIVDLEGKGSRVRSVPMPVWAKAAVDRWMIAAGVTSGAVFRAIDRNGGPSQTLSAQAIYLIVRGYAGQLGLRVAPHDLRRTFAKLAHRGKAPLEQIQLSLGHESILTTERYLGMRQSLIDAPCDHLGIDLPDG